jgi:hypothetical protein
LEKLGKSPEKAGKHPENHGKSWKKPERAGV